MGLFKKLAALAVVVGAPWQGGTENTPPKGWHYEVVTRPGRWMQNGDGSWGWSPEWTGETLVRDEPTEGGEQ